MKRVGGWNRKLKAIITVYERRDMPRVYIYESIGDVLRYKDCL